MYCLIVKILATLGNRELLISILLEWTKDRRGCLSYVIAEDGDDENALWITEVWDMKASHTASLSLPSVQSAVANGKPLIERFGERF